MNLLKMSSSEDEDYMSDTILSKCADTRPGLLNKHENKQIKREVKQQKQNVLSRTKPLKVLEAERRDEGLKEALKSDNKGYALLQKMGYKPGMALGKKGDGHSEPIPIVHKINRGGLGQESEFKRKKEEQEQNRLLRTQKRKKFEENWTQDFHTRMSQQNNQREIERDLYRSQDVCLQLDLVKEIKEPHEKFFWPEHALPSKVKVENDEDEENAISQAADGLSEDEETETEETEEDNILSANDRLCTLTAYLRSSYLYCVWCGTQFEDNEDLRQNCPGDTAAAHD